MAKRRRSESPADEHLRVVAYLRQSKARPGERKDTSLSLEAQEMRFREDEQRHQFQTLAVIRDHDLKGTDPSRPGIRDLFTHCESGVDAVWVFKVDRFARDPVYQELTWRSLKDLGVRRLISHVEPYADDDLTRGMLGIFAKKQLDDLSDFISASANARARRGHWHGEAPYGYTRLTEIPYTDKDGREKIRRSGPITPHPDQKAHVIYAFERWLQGATLWGIAGELNTRGIPSARGLRWDAHMIRHLLTNAVCVGDVSMNGEVVAVNAHPAIIDRETFAAAKERFDGMKIVRRKRTGLGSWVEGLVYHSCGARMYLYGITRHQAGLPDIPSFGCRSSYAQSVEPCGQPRRHIVVGKLEPAVRACLTIDLASAVSLDAAIERGQDLAGGEQTLQARAMLEDRRRLADRRYARVREGWLSSDQGPEWLAEETAKHAAEIETIERELAALPELPDPERYAQIASTIAEVASAIGDMPTTDVQLLLTAAGVVIVSEEGVRIRYHAGYQDFVPHPTTVSIPKGATSGS